MEDQVVLEIQVLCLDKEGSVLYSINKQNKKIDSSNKKLQKFLKYKEGIRDHKKKINNDDVIVVNLS